MTAGFAADETAGTPDARRIAIAKRETIRGASFFIRAKIVPKGL
jgi:hypothetical protein